MCLWGHNGRARYGGGEKYKESGVKFTVGDSVLVRVNLEKGLIEWTVNRSKKTELNCGMLSEPGRRFFPYF